MKRLELVCLMPLILLLTGCLQPKYDRWEQQELARNVRYDSLFLGIKFGMARKDFYGSCWEMNKQGLIMQGPGNLSVEYKLDSPQVKAPTFMRFYPNFQDDRIFEMPVEFQYESWAPWNQQLSVDTLLLDVKRLMEDWYGGSFRYFENEDKSLGIWAKVDGNRRIRLYKKNISTVKAEFADLTVEKKPTDETKENAEK